MSHTSTTTKSISWNKALQAYVERLTKEGRHPSTTRGYLNDLSLFAKWYQGTYGKQPDVKSVQDVDLLAYCSFLQVQKRRKPTTVNRKVAALRSFFGYLSEEGVTGESIIKNLKLLEEPEPGVPEVLTNAQVLRLFGSINKNSWQGKRDFAIIQLFVQCGLRRSEAAAIEVGDVEIGQGKGVLRIPSDNGGKPREVPLNRTAREALRDYLTVRPKSPGVKNLFVSRKRSPLAASSVHDVVKRCMGRAGIQGFSPRDLRHLFAVTLYNRYKDIILVKEALGHKRIESTFRYSRRTAQEMAQALEDTEFNIKGRKV